MKKRHYLTADDLERIRHMIEVEYLQQWKVADEIGVYFSTIQKLCKRLGLKTQRTGPRGGPGHPDWKGGRTKSKGYWYVWCENHPFPGKGKHYVAEHRLVMEKKLGRYLLPGEVCHHIDSDPLNNDPENLIVFGSNGLHLKHELAGRCPKWTPEGLQRLDAERKSARRKNHRKAQDGQHYPRSTDRPQE